MVDHSSGTSIMGVSVFFNRYVGNVKSKSQCNIDGCKPLKFFNLRNALYTNIAPTDSYILFSSDNNNITKENNTLTPYYSPIYFNYDP